MNDLFSLVQHWSLNLGTLTKQTVYHLSHTPQPFFALIVLWIETCISCLGLALDGQSFYLQLPQSWEYRSLPPHSAYFLKWDFANFLLGLAFNQDAPDLCLPSSWDYRCVPPLLALWMSFEDHSKKVYLSLKKIERHLKTLTKTGMTTFYILWLSHSLPCR
jgi:hypothetical protein